PPDPAGGYATGLPRNRNHDDRGRRILGRRRLRLSRYFTVARSPRSHHRSAQSCTSWRLDSLPAAGSTDGTRGHHRVLSGQHTLIILAINRPRPAVSTTPRTIAAQCARTTAAQNGDA